MDSHQGRHQDAEMETFLPNSNNTDNTNPKHKPVIVRTVQDGEKLANGTKRDVLDELFRTRNNPSPTTDFETFTHLLKAALGSGILSMPYAFKCSGLAIGLLATLVTAFVCTYCSYLLVKCAHSLYRRLNIPKMSYADVAEHSFANGPRSFRKWAKVARMCVIGCLFVTYFGAISCYTVIAGENFKQLVEHYCGEYYPDFKGINIRIYILATLPVLLVLGFIPNLKALAPFSLVANLLIGSGLGITIFYLVQNLANPFTVRQTPEKLIDLPATFSITVFAMEAIGLMMPLENNMKTPTHFLGTFGVLSKGMTVVSGVYILIGVLGFLSYGDNTEANITKNLDINLIAPQVAKLFIALSVLLTYVLQYFVCLDILWNAVKDNFVKQEKLYNGFCRMTLVGGSVLLAITVPNIGPFVSLIGALCFSFLGILFPLVIEMVTYSQRVSMVKLIFRNSFIVLFGIMALCVGTYTSIQDILSIYLPTETDTILMSNSTGTVSSR